jgi:hypothetical protein
MALTPEEKAAAKAELARRQAAESTPETYVSDKDYKTLKALYEAAKKSSNGNPNKVTKETEDFQRAYHKILPDEAKRIIGKHPVPTAKALRLGLDPLDLEGNAEGMFGPRTEQYWQSVKQKPAAEPTALADVVKGPEADRDPIQRNTPVPYTESKKAPWWLQDIIKVAGAVGDKARIKKYLPWQASPEVRLPEATFYDPTRELAANTEMANMALQNSAAFTSPQQQAAANSVAQGQMAKSAADVLGRYNNLNVGVANQLSKDQTNIMNVASQNKANLDTQLWDKYTIANQQFDNAKSQARQNIRQSYIDAITNRANTANLNSLYPQYAVDPSSGGFAYFKNPRAAEPTRKYDHIDALWEKAKAMSPNDPQGMMKLLLGKGASADLVDPADGAYEGYNNNQQAVS